MSCFIVLYCDCIVFCCIVLYCTVIVLYCFELHCIALHCIVMCCAVLHNNVPKKPFNYLRKTTGTSINVGASNLIHIAKVVYEENLTR